MATLVTGGAGYIGAHLVRRLIAAGEAVVVVDDLSTGRAGDVDRGAELLEGDAGDPAVLDRALGRGDVSAVMHLAGRSLVAESVREPELYRRSIAGTTRALLEAMARAGVGRLVFSSSAAVYGEPETAPITEDHPLAPGNPYGAAKREAEALIEAATAGGVLAAVSLRYFNAAGASPAGDLAERHDPETHLIPLLLEVAAGRRPSIEIHGVDYPTADGTCVRDYVHVDDIAAAHGLAVDWLAGRAGHHAFNLGNGAGFSVREVIAAVERVTGQAISATEGARRPGDVATLVADASRARGELGWSPVHAELDEIVAHAWAAASRGAP